MELFEEQAIESTTQKPKIWKHYVDETITILDRSYVECLLQHLNSQQPTIRFTMETEKDNKIVFLDSLVMGEPYRRLTNSVYRKLTHTNQYLAHDSHHPQWVRRGIVKCLHDRAKRLAKKSSVMKEKRHWSVPVSNGFPSSFVQKVTKTGNSSPSRRPVT